MEKRVPMEVLQKIGQEHLLDSWDQLSQVEQFSLNEQIQRLNLHTFKEQQQLLQQPLSSAISCTPPDHVAKSGNHADQNEGSNLISEGKLGCLIVAGGQGTRLKFPGPKGMFPVSVVKQKSLFQIFAEKTVAASEQARVKLPLAIMTSPQNHQETIEYFHEHHYFGLDRSQVSFFKQSSLPFLNTEGNLFFEEKGKIAEGPDGNGSALHRFFESGIWENWKMRGIDYVNFIIVDNPLADPFDAELLGHLARTKSDVVIKGVVKESPEESVGLVVKKDKHLSVIEYSEMNDEMRQKRDSNGSLQFHCANISLFCFRMEFISRLVEDKFPLPLHIAFKAAKEMGAPDKIDVWKFEKFIFDVLPASKKTTILLYPREQVFAPLKNFSGKDSIDTVKAALENADRKTLEAITGLSISQTPLEISQKFYYPTKQLLSQWKKREIPLGTPYID